MKAGDKFRVNKTVATIVERKGRLVLCDVHNERSELIGRFVLNVEGVKESERTN